MSGIFYHDFRKLNNFLKTCISEEASILIPCTEQFCSSAYSCHYSGPSKAFPNSSATPLSLSSVLLNVTQKSEQHRDTLVNVPPNSSCWPDVRNE